MNSNDTTPKLRFTGERLIPGETDPDLFNEHFARYVYARMFCSGKIVLDTGCGVGYGSLYLAESARCVVGVDNDAAAIEYARSRYCSGNTAYVVGDCQNLPFPPRAFQVITSFELIEHLLDANAYLAEVRRVLEPKGLFLVSTPNRPVYAEHRGSTPNPFHVREWDFDEFVALLRSYFKFVEVLGETHLPSVGILGSGKGKPVRASVESAPPPAAADYFVCVCSNEPQYVEQIVFTSSSANVLRVRERHIKALQIELEEFRSHITGLRAEFEEKGRWANKLNSEVSEQRRTIATLQQELRTVTFLWNKATRGKRLLVFSALALLNFVLGATVIGAEITGRLLRKLRRYPAPFEGPKNNTRCSIIIPSWNGKELLAESLPPLIRAVELHGDEHEIIVVDNGSTDGTREYVAEHFPEVRVVRSDRNLFFSGGSNLGIQSAKNDIFVLLNNDMVVHEDFLAPLLSGFTAPDVFAVGSQVSPADPGKRREETGKTHATFNGCDFDWSHEPINRGDVERKYVPVFWGHGGAAAIDRGKFLWLGGFDPHFDPFYVEDADVSYRAWKVGWRCLLAVDSQVVHKRRGTIGPRFSAAFINQVIRRNEYFFIWKNLGSLRMLVSHFLYSPIRAMQRAGVPEAGIRLEARAFLGAAKRLFSILISKVRLCVSTTRTDYEILGLTNTPPAESIFESDLDFSQDDFSEHLGEGWYPREQINGQSFRWTSKYASVFLRAPGEAAELCVRGYVTGSRRHGRTRFVLSVDCEGERKRFSLEEGPFEQRWLLPKLQPSASVPVLLAVNNVLTDIIDRRTLGVIVHRVALLPPASSRSAGHIRVLHPSTISRNASSSAPQTSEQRRVLMVCAYLPCLGVHSGGNTMFYLIRSLSKRHRLSVLSFCEQESELEHIEQLTPYCERL